MADSKERSQLDTKLNSLLYCRGKRVIERVKTPFPKTSCL